MLLATLAAALLGAALAAAAEPGRPYPTVIALGYTAPLGSRQGLGTPIVVADHESGGYFGAGTLTVQLHTSQLQVGMRHGLPVPLALGYRGSAEVIAARDGTDLYRDGVREVAQTFRGNTAALALTATLFPHGAWRLHWEGERLQARFAGTSGSAATFIPPGDFTQVEQRLRLRRQGLLGQPAARLGLTWTLGRRGDWRAWSGDPDAAAHARYRKLALRWKQPLAWTLRQRSQLALAALTGHSLDLLSGYRVGGFAGRESVAGYYRNEFRARRALVLNAQHTWRLAEDRRLSVLLDAARLNELATPYQPTPPAARTLLGVGLEVYYGLRWLGGVPLIVRYGQGLRVPPGSPEGHRREVLVLLAAGF